ncbi:MAG: hypothetical protein U9M94_01355 [Patescibacteria group bacterium]|nr:hypothetical protein [Patescibacteria group bacterium]
MLSYLEKFSQLPQELRAKISAPEVMAAIKELEEKYNVSLAAVIMRIMVKDISILDLSKYFVFEHDLDARQAERLVDGLKSNVLFVVADYLGIAEERQDDIANGGNDSKQLDDWTQNRKKEAEVRGSNFFFSTEDEEEVKGLAKKLESFKTDNTENKRKQLNYDNVINAVSKEIGVNFSSEDLRKRFFGIITMYLKGIRNKVDTKQTLFKDINSGGLAFSEIYTDNILVLVDKKRIEEEKKQENKTAKGGEIAIESARDMDYDFSHFTKATRDKSHFAKASVSAKAMEDKPEGGQQITKIESAGKIIEDKKKIFKPSKLKFEIAKQPSLKRPKVKSGKARMDDVKHTPKLLGPIDELKEMDLLNFRRLSDDLSVRIKKISEKIEFLEEENYAQRLSGIKAWRQSKLNKMYLDIGKESISANRGIDDIINSRQEKGEDCLNKEEFLLIMELNKTLRY